MVRPSHPPACLMFVSWNFFSSLSGSSLNILTVASFIVASGRPFHTLIILCIKKWSEYYLFFLKAEGEGLTTPNLSLVIAGGQLIGKQEQPNTHLPQRSDFMSNCHVKGNLVAGSVKPNNRQRLNRAVALVTYVPCLEV